MNTNQTLNIALDAIRAADNQIFRIGGYGALSAQLAQARDAMKALVTEQTTTYTVLLLRPDYIADDESDTYLTTVKAEHPAAALDKARLEAAEADGCEPEAGIDYAALLVIAGAHDDLNPET